MPIAATVPAASLVLVIAASLCWAGIDLLRKVLARQLRPVPLIFLLCLGAVPIFAAWTAMAGAFRFAPGYLVPALASVALNVAANLAFLQALRVSPLSVTIPLLSLTPVFATLLAVPLLGERPAPEDGFGILLVVVGALWLNCSQGRPGRPMSQGPPGRTLPPGRPGRPMGSNGFRSALRGERGPWLMAATALLWSLTIPLDKLAVEHSNPPFHGLFLNAGVAVGALAVLLARRELAEVTAVRKLPGVYVATLVLSVLALGLQLVALRTVWVSVVETLKRGTGNLAAVVLGGAVFGEAITGRKLAAVALMATGVAILLF